MAEASRHALPLKEQSALPRVVDGAVWVWVAEGEDWQGVCHGGEAVELHNIGSLQILPLIVRLSSNSRVVMHFTASNKRH